MSFDENEFQEFKTSEASPSLQVQSLIFNRVHADLNPSPWFVFSKLSAIHIASALLTLSVCPQFGFRFFGEEMGLMGTFMKLGDYGCMIACGSFFLGVSLLAAVLTLKLEELKTLHQHRWVQIASLITLSFGALIMLGDQMILALSVTWLVGTLIGAFSILELGWFMRKKIRL